MPDAPTFEAYVASERERINKERDKLRTSRQGIDQKLADLDRELLAITAYENAKAGRITPSTRAPRSAGTGTRRTGIREEVLSHIKSSGSVTRSTLLAGMNVKGDKAGEQSVSNALAALKKAGSITAKDGNYTAV